MKNTPPPFEKIQKVLARTGFASRREAERWIMQGRIRVDGKVAQLGDRIHPDNRVALDQKALYLDWHQLKPRVLVYHKPEGEICSRHDPAHDKTIFDRLPRLKIGRWIAIGRLDINTTGVILLTNDGELANRLMHPSREIEREYAVRILGDVTDSHVQQLKQGVMLEDGPARFEKIFFSGGEGANKWYHVVLKEGRNREVRRMWEATGLRVSRLSRIRFGNITLRPRQKPGRFEDLSTEELAALYKSVGLHYNPPAANTAQKAGSRRKGLSRQKSGWQKRTTNHRQGSKKYLTPDRLRQRKKK